MRARLRELSTSVAIYGAGDVAVQVVSFVLLPIYLLYLTAADYGALALLVSVEALSKIVSRWGLDGAFMRYYLDQPDQAGRRRLASTLLLFQAAATGTLFVILMAASGPFARALFGDPEHLQYLTALRLVLVNILLVSFTYVPFHLMRMEKRAVAFSALTFTRSVSTLLLRVAFVMGAGYGVTGLALADLVVTVALLPILWRVARPILGLTFSADELRRALRFGLPRLPHGLAQQALDAGIALLLSRYLSLSGLGVYQIGATIGRAIKLFLSAFETGWAPFYYETAREAGAKVVFSKITTYGVALLALLVAAIGATATDLVAILTPQNFVEAGRVVPLIALGIAFQGVYLLTSIGLNLTGRTEYYPASTIIAASVGLGAGLILMPRFGAIGAGASFALSYLTLALVAGVFAQRVYPIGYEAERLGRVILSAIVAGSVGVAPQMTGSAWIDVVIRPVVVVAIFGVMLWGLRFFRPSERQVAADVLRRWRRKQ